MLTTHILCDANSDGIYETCAKWRPRITFYDVIGSRNLAQRWSIMRNVQPPVDRETALILWPYTQNSRRYDHSEVSRWLYPLFRLKLLSGAYGKA